MPRRPCVSTNLVGCCSIVVGVCAAGVLSVLLLLQLLLLLLLLEDDVLTVRLLAVRLGLKGIAEVWSSLLVLATNMMVVMA